MRNMDGQDRHRYVQCYVERQKAYLPTYTTEQLSNERHGTPSKSLQSDGEFGFDTPVLRPRRVPEYKAVQSRLTDQAERAKSRAHGPSPNQSPAPPRAPPEEVSSNTRDPAQGKKDKSRSKRKKASTPTDTDNERAARLADRRERKRKKRAIVNPSQKHDDDNDPTAAQKRGRANGQKAKTPIALALMYGFSATNVTKDRLTLRPAPSLGVFSKGRASAKKKVTATGKHSSRNELFSESTFLNKPTEQVADHPEVEDDADGSSSSSISDHPISQAVRAHTKKDRGRCTKHPEVEDDADGSSSSSISDHPISQAVRAHTKKDRGRCTKAPAVKMRQTSNRTAAESEVWDIELQSKLPSSALDVSSECGTKKSAPVVLDLRGAEWAASINVTEEHERCRNEAWASSLPVARSRSRGHSVARSSPPAVSSKHEERGIPHAVDVSPIHPSHSASQVGRRATDTQPFDLSRVASKYFAELKPASVQEFTADKPQPLRSNDDIDVLCFQTPDQDVEDAPLDVQTICRGVSPISLLTSIPQPIPEFRTQRDIIPLEFPSDVSPHDHCYARVDVPCELLGGTYRGYLGSSVVQTEGGRSISATGYHFPHEDTTWDWCPPADLANDDVEGVSMEHSEGPYDPLAREFEDDLGEPESAIKPCFFETQGEYDDEEGQFSEQWHRMAEAGQDFPEYEDEAVNESICYSEESLRDEESAEEVPGFLEGRALLLGIPERPECVGLSGLVQAEMDVASRLRDHWRPLRL